MGKTVKNVKNSLKFKAQPRVGVLSVKVGVKKYAVPIDARLVAGGQYVFLSFPASAELYKVENKELKKMDAAADASDAHAVLAPKRRGTRRRAAEAAVLPSNLAEALKNIPAGYRLGYGPDGEARLVRKRQRRK